MEDIEKGINYLQNHTRRLYEYIEKMSLGVGYKCNKYMENISARKKYWCEVLLRVPLIFIIHQWLLLGPYSNYWVIDVVLFVLRYGLALLLTGTWSFNIGVLFHAYISLTIDIAMTWIKHIDYWTIQDSTYGICHEKNVLAWSDLTDNVSLPLMFSIMLQLAYLIVRPGALTHREKENSSSLLYVALLSTLIPKVLSFLGIFPAFLSECSYWIDSTLFIMICFFEAATLLEVDAKVDARKLSLLKLKHALAITEESKQKCQSDIDELTRRIDNRNKGQNFADRFPGKWFLRDTVLLFGIFYLCLLLFIEVTVNQRSVTSMISMKTIFEISSNWCTTQIIIVFISYCFGLVSNVTVALSHWFLTTEVHIVEAFNANIGGVVQVVALITFTEANVLGLENFERLEAMKLVAFLSIYAIIFQTLDVVEQKILQAVNSGTSPGILFYLRTFVLSGLLVTIPSLSTFKLARSLDISPWLLFFASGNCTLLLRTISLLFECALIKATWYTTNHLAQIEDVLHYTRVCRTLLFVVCNCAQSYCRYICPFFKGWWLLRLCLALFSFVAVAGVLGMNEFDRYKTRKSLFTLLGNLQDVSFQQTVEAGVEESDDCAICYNKMSKAKKLPCNHLFHNDCLRKWFQVRTVCPLCNTEIKVESVKIQNQRGSQ